MLRSRARLTLLRLQIVTVAVAASYLTLGLLDEENAERLWWAYALGTLVLALLMMTMERRRL